MEIPNGFLDVHQDLTVSMNVLKVNSLKFLSTISHELYHRTAQYVVKPVATIYKICMEKLLTVYKKGGFNIIKIHCDNKFRKLMDQFSEKQDLPIKMNYAAAQKRVLQDECNNCVIQ